MIDIPSPPLLPVLVICPPAQQAALAAALPPAAFQSTFAAPQAGAAVPPPAVILFSLDDAAALPRLDRLAVSGPPVVVLLATETALATEVLAAGASDYVYRLGNWAALLPFHLRRAAQAPLAQAAQQRAVRQLAHDLRGPLSYLVGYSELLTMGDFPPEKIQQMAQEMLREAEKLANYIDRFAPPPTG